MRRDSGPHLLLILLLVPTFVRAQTSPAPARIQLTPGGPTVTVEGDVERDKKEVVFVFQAKAESKFSGHLKTTSGKAGFEVNDADGAGLPEEEFDFNTNLTGSLPKTGDYKIAVATFDPRRVHLTLTVRVYR
jgi:hypothetical protein